MNMQATQRTYGTLALAGDRWCVSGVPPHVSLRFKTFFTRIPKAQTGQFLLANTPDTCSDLLWFMQRFPLLMDVADRKALEHGNASAIQRQAEADRIMAGEWQRTTIPGFRDGCEPYPFQDQAAQLAVTLGRLLVMDDVGLGKTITALAALCKAQAFPAAIVVQAHLAEQWVEEYIQAFTTLTAHIIKGTKPYPLPPVDLYIFKYSNIGGWADIAAAGTFKAVVYDEIQELRHGASTVKGTAAQAFSRHASIKIGLTATPIYNYGSEIYNVVEYIGPGALGMPHEFFIEWCNSGQRIVKDPVALGSYLRESSLVVRRREADVGKQMPQVNVLMHHIDFDQDVLDAVADEARALALRVLNGSFTDRGQAARELDMMARHATGMAKAKGVAALARMLVESDARLLLAGWHRDVYDVWLDALGDLNPVMYTGTETAKQKNAAKHAFINGTSPLMLISLRSGAGLDGLQLASNTVMFGELDWSPQVHRQVIGRLRRPGQKHQVDAIYAHTNGGSDPVLVEMLGLKASQSHGITDPLSEPEALRAADDTRIRQLAKAYVEGRGMAAPALL